MPLCGSQHKAVLDHFPFDQKGVFSYDLVRLEKTLNKTLALVAAALLLSSCTVSKDQTTLALEGQGYSNIELGGPALWGCSEDDNFTRTWKATGSNGVRVKGVACSSLFKGVTIRTQGRA